jgi:pimeloyl-ACP methyl ester carboxylesterase
MVEPRSRYFVSNGLRLHYVCWGNEANQPLVLVHGGRDHGRSWDFVARELVDRYAVYALDLRGHGESDWVGGSFYRLTDYVADLATLLRVLARGPVRLIGHSLGGRIVLDYAGACPEGVSKLVSIEGFGWRFLSPSDADQRLRRFLSEVEQQETRADRVYETLEAATQRMWEANRRLSDEMARHLTQHAVRQGPEGGYVWKFDPRVRLRPPPEWTAADMKTIWQKVTAPMLLVAGAESQFYVRPEDIDPLGLGAGEYVVFANAGHWVHHDALNEFVQRVRRFLA